MLTLLLLRHSLKYFLKKYQVDDYTYWNWKSELVILFPLCPEKTNIDSRATATGKMRVWAGRFLSFRKNRVRRKLPRADTTATSFDAPRRRRQIRKLPGSELHPRWRWACPWSTQRCQPRSQRSPAHSAEQCTSGRVQAPQRAASTSQKPATRCKRHQQRSKRGAVRNPDSQKWSSA